VYNIAMTAHTKKTAQGATTEQVLLIVEEVDEGDWKTNCCYGLDGKTPVSHTHYFVVDKDSDLFNIVDEGRDDLIDMVIRHQVPEEHEGISRDELDALINYADNTRRYFSRGTFESLNISGILYTSYVTDEY
jgi:hypothetical protein